RGPLVPFDQGLVSIDDAALESLLGAALPFERVAAPPYRIPLARGRRRRRRRSAPPPDRPRQLRGPARGRRLRRRERLRGAGRSRGGPGGTRAARAGRRERGRGGA